MRQRRIVAQLAVLFARDVVDLADGREHFRLLDGVDPRSASRSRSRSSMSADSRSSRRPARACVSFTGSPFVAAVQRPRRIRCSHRLLSRLRSAPALSRHRLVPGSLNDGRGARPWTAGLRRLRRRDSLTASATRAAEPLSRTRSVRWTTSSSAAGRPAIRLSQRSRQRHQRCGRHSPEHSGCGRTPSFVFTQRNSIMLICEPKPAPRCRAY